MSTAPTGVAALPGIAAAAGAGAAEAAAAGPAAAAVAAATAAVAGVAAAVAAGAAAAAEAGAAAAAAAAAAGVEAAAHERSAGVTVAAIAVARGAITEVITTPPPKPLATRPEARSQLHNMQPLRVQWRRPDRNHGTRKLGIQHPQTWYLCSSGGPSPCSGGQQPCPHHQRCPAIKG